jgi:arabinofuranosyltransferase
LRKGLAIDVLGALAVLIAAVIGWRVFWFLTDDSFISFRYAHNLVHGRGLVWNPAPFRPVDGYTSLLWTVLLAAIWEVTGLQPPEVVNPLSLLCGLGTLFLTARLVRGIAWPGRAGRWVMAATMVGTVTDRTFLAWLSSGLETAFFDLQVTGWVVAAALEGPWSSWTATLTAWATLCAFTRPDGVLLIAGTFALVAIRAWREPPAPRDLSPLWGFALVLLVAVWHRRLYGWWLPNTYYAKYVEAWPEAGVRYALSFFLEYGLAIPLLAAVVWLGFAIARRVELPGYGAAVAGAVLASHLAFYTLRIGGVLFVYRV